MQAVKYIKDKMKDIKEDMEYYERGAKINSKYWEGRRDGARQELRHLNILLTYVLGDKVEEDINKLKEM